MHQLGRLLIIAVVLFLTFNLWAGYWGVAVGGTGLLIGARFWKRRCK
ncbi:hypothetical protein K9N68_10085 [Kovacikia minuta CCNUW1]|nr:hypothetical protein [Kovacikia minuta]UBF28192.1 hypothetical protein K9N68_10085 [Kovacikia minuta CCNUW1]